MKAIWARQVAQRAIGPWTSAATDTFSAGTVRMDLCVGLVT